jgi:TolB protein
VFTQFQSSTGRFHVAAINPDGSGLTVLPVGGTPLLLNGSLRASAVARWSPDGRRIAITTSSTSGAFETIVNADGTGPRDLIRPDSTLDLRCLAWSPDGQRLACQGSDSTKPNRQGMYTVRSSDGGGLKRLTTSSGAGDVPGDYSPDGTQIAFVRQTYSIVSLGQLWICNTDGSNVRKVTDTLVGYDVSWSPGGHLIAGDANGALLIFDLDHLGVGPREIVLPKGSAAQPRWSPDGSGLVFQFVNAAASAPDIYTVNADGSDPHRLTTSPESDDSPDWGKVR